MANLTHFVISMNSYGASERTPLKSWLRSNPDVLPGIDPSAMTTHQLRGILLRNGWQLREAGSEMLLLHPELPENQAKIFLDAVEADSVATLNDADQEFSFELEHQLRDFLIANLASIPVNGKRLDLFKGADGRIGREYPTEVGFIDVLAADESGALYVIELKRGRTSDHTVGQILRYMGWCRRKLAQGKPVYGVIVAQAYDEKLKFAASEVSGLSIFEYEIAFRLRSPT